MEAIQACTIKERNSGLGDKIGTIAAGKGPTSSQSTAIR